MEDHTRVRGDLMIRNTVHSVAEKLKHLLRYDISAERSIQLLSGRARSVEEMVVVEVMRESYKELRKIRPGAAAQADSNSRSARMPGMALRR